jgi:NTE family protein
MLLKASTIAAVSPSDTEPAKAPAQQRITSIPVTKTTNPAHKGDKRARRARSPASPRQGESRLGRRASDPADAAPSKRTSPDAPVVAKTVTLALQGGGAHGAFTWGVLDRLLEEERINIEGISATSAGAMNATVFTYGYASGGRDGAKAALAQFWKSISFAAMRSPLQPSWLDRMIGDHSLRFSPAFVMIDIVTRLCSPYELNPFNRNPLKDLLEEVVDFTALRRSDCPIKLFLTATNVRTGKVKVFERREIDAPHVLASSCLPFLFQAVEIEGEHYWDGGYMGNPAIFPLIYNCQSRDIVIVHVNPVEREEIPCTAMEILNRVNEITFNSSLMREMRAISFVTKLIDERAIDENRLKRLYIHSISADEVMKKFGVSSKLNADWSFLKHLHAAGRQYADAWIEESFDRLGVESTVDIRAQYL